MSDVMFEPLKFYKDFGKNEFNSKAAAFFDDLVAKSGIDVERNRATVREYNRHSAELKSKKDQKSGFKILRGVLITLAVLGFLMLFAGYADIVPAYMNTVAMCITGSLTGIICLISVFFVVNPRLRQISEEVGKKEGIIRRLHEKALSEMAPLNALYDDTDTIRLIESVMPEIKFDLCYTRQAENALVKRCGFWNMLGKSDSVVDTLSGYYAGNPFLFYKYRRCEIVNHVYSGSIVISWQEETRDSEGNRKTITRTQTLTATVKKPAPRYRHDTVLIYGHQAAPELHFSRMPSHSENLSERELKRKVETGERRLRELGKRSITEGGSFQPLTNSEFEVLFNALNRDHEVQYRLMYTPLAQVNTLALLKSKEGYGDDFEFYKNGRFNLIRSGHAQAWLMSPPYMRMPPYDVDAAKAEFLKYNNEYFKSLFFDFAPLLSVPAYSEKPAYSLEDIGDYGGNYTNYEHQVMANDIGEKFFVHPKSTTRAILRATLAFTRGDSDFVDIDAYSYSGQKRIENVSVYGGDGRWHTVPVPWIEYLPVTAKTRIEVRSFGKSRREFEKTGYKAKEAPWAYRHGLLANITRCR